jgi:hypothetical protein
MTRRTKLACLVAAGVVGVGLIWATSRTPADIGLKDAAVGDPGLSTEAEVVARFGPPGNYATRKRDYEFCKMRGPRDPCRDEGWYDDFAFVLINFHNDGTVACWHRAMVKPPPPWHERLERFLRGLW